MGQTQNEEGGKKGKKEKEKENDKVILKVYMHCEACKKKVRKALKSLPGIDNVDLNLNEQKATITGKVNPMEVYAAVRKKCGKGTVLLYPEQSEKEKQETMINSITKIVDSINDLLNPKPPDTTLELKVKMHCGACAKQIKKILLKMDGVTEVNEDLVSDKVVVKGRGLVAEHLCDRVKRLGKHCEVISLKKDEKKEKKSEEAKKKEDKKENEKKEDKNENEKKEDKKENEKNEKNEEKNENEKKEDKNENEKKGNGNGNGNGNGKNGNGNGNGKNGNGNGNSNGKNEKKKGNGAKEGKEEVKEDLKNDKLDEEEWNTKADVKKYVYPSYASVSEYAYPPQLFSDENPNACSIM